MNDELDCIRAYIINAQRELNNINISDIVKTGVDNSVAEQTINYVQSQLQNALIAISNIS